MDINSLFREQKKFIEDALDYLLPGEEEYPQSIHRAMRYSVFAGGKRIRPLLVLSTAQIFTSQWEKAVPVACALELIHTYSLIHDDLPAMDDDDFRRGRLTSHKVFGEAVAILAGDALLTLAFEILAGEYKKEREFAWLYYKEVPPGLRLKVLAEIAAAAGVKGMIGGQVVDLESEGKKVGENIINYIYSHKTGALLVASVRAGARIGGSTPEELKRLTSYADLMGKAFQLVDDLLDLEGNETKMGKSKGVDLQRQKATFVSCWGLEEAVKKRDQLYGQAMEMLEGFGKRAEELRQLTRFIFFRDY